MSFLEPSGLAWLGLVPVLVALYFMKLRRREVQVSAAFLWRKAAKEARVDSFFQKLRINLLLLLQLLALLLLVGCLARPYRLAPGHLAKQVVLMLDCSASMQARLEGSTRFEAARQAALKLVRQAPAQAEIMVVELGAQARVLVPFSQDKSAILTALKEAQVQDAEGDLAAVRPLTLSVALSKPGAELYLLGDRLPEGPLHPNMRFLGFGHKGRNLAVGGFQVVLAQGHRQAFVAVASYSDQAESEELRIYQKGKLVLSRQLQVAAGSRRSLLLPLPDSDLDDPYQLKLALADDLEADNQAWALAPRQLSLQVALAGPVSRFVEKALLAQPRVQLRRGQQAEAALTVWEEPPDQLPPGNHWLLQVPAGWRNGTPSKRVSLLIAENHPIMAGLPLDRVAVTGVVPLQLSGWKQEVLARAEGQPALLLLHNDRSQLLLNAFDLGASDLPLSPALPMLVARFLEQGVAGQLDSAPDALVAGQELSLRSTLPIDLVDPQGQTHTLKPRGGRCSTLETTRAGLYRLQTATAKRQLAVNLISARESNLQEPPPNQEGGLASGGPGGAGSMLEEYWWQLTALALAVLLLEWFFYWGGARLFRGI